MNQYLDPRYDKTEDGIWVKRDFKSFIEPEVQDVYPRVYTDTMVTDVGHYGGFDSALRPRYPEMFLNHYDICYSFGGGVPKLESHLNIDKIVIIDGMVEFYNQHLNKFRNLYNYHRDIEFVQLIFNSDIISRFSYDKSKKTLFTFIHVLEHQTLDEHLNILKKLPKGIDVIVYGPNISRAVGPGWVHLQDFILDHNTFIPYLKMKELIEGFGYKIYYSTQYSDDLLFYFNTGDEYESARE